MNSPSHTKPIGVLLVFMSAVLFGSYGVWSRLIGGAMPTFFQSWVRALIIFLILLPIGLHRRVFRPIPRADRPWLVAALVCTAFSTAPIFYAFTHMDIGTASLLFFVTFFLTMQFIGRFFLHERLDTIKLISIGGAVLGLCCVFSFSLSTFTLTAAGMAVLNGIASGGEMALSKKLSSKIPNLAFILFCWATIVISNLIFSLLLHEQQVPFSFTLPWLWLSFFALAGVFGFWWVINGLKDVDASLGSLILLFEVIFSIFFGIVFFGEHLNISTVVGATLIIGSAALPNLIPLLKGDKNR